MKSSTNQDLKKIVKDGLFEVLKSDEGKDLIKVGAIEAFKSNEGRYAVKDGVVDALESQEGKKAIIKVLKSREAKDIFIDNFVEAFHDSITPAMQVMSDTQDDQTKRIEELERKGGFVT